MEVPFKKDRRLDRLATSGSNYAVVFQDSPDTFEFKGFKERDKAWKEACSVAGVGLYCYVLSLMDSDYPVIAYLSGFCNRK